MWKVPGRMTQTPNQWSEEGKKAEGKEEKKNPSRFRTMMFSELVLITVLGLSWNTGFDGFFLTLRSF